jgi:ATP synthase protein I
MAENEPGQDPVGGDARIDHIGERLRDITQREQAEASGKGSGVDANYRLGNRVLADLLGGIAGGLLFGWLFDRWLGTSPWLLITFLALGIIVAFRNIIRVSNAYSAGLKNQQPSQDKPED